MNSTDPGEEVATPCEHGRALTDRQKRIVAAALVIHVTIATVTLRDLSNRPAVAVRGPRWLWRLWVSLNTTGSMAYWLFGRRRSVHGLSVSPP